MGRQRGIFLISGTLGDINFFITKGKGYTRTAGGGFNREAIKNNPNMQRVRENASEFGHCSQVKKAFRLALMPFLHGYRERKLHARMMRLFMGIKVLDGVSERGKRRVGMGLQTAKGRRLLEQFAITPRHSLLDALKQQSSFDWNTQRLTISDFAPKAYKAPKAATHVGVTLGVLDFDFDSLAHSLAVSPTHFIEVGSGATSFELVPEQVVLPVYTGIVVLGVRFYEVIETEVYGLDSMIGVGLLAIRI